MPVPDGYTLREGEKKKVDSSFRPCCIWLAVVGRLAKASQPDSQSVKNGDRVKLFSPPLLKAVLPGVKDFLVHHDCAGVLGPCSVDASIFF